MKMHLHDAAQGLLLMEAPVRQDEHQLAQRLAAAAARRGAVSGHVQHVHQHRQQLHHRPVRQRVVLQQPRLAEHWHDSPAGSANIRTDSQAPPHTSACLAVFASQIAATQNSIERQQPG